MMWPATDTQARKSVPRDALTEIPTFLRHCKRRGLIVQAGGNVGVYPLELAKHFGHVITFEPDDENYACLRQNIEGVSNISAHHAALGEILGLCTVEVAEAHNSGAHRICAGVGRTPVLALDDLFLPAPCDAIWLDVEGYELAILRGARRIIDEDGPIIAIEDKGLGRHFGIKDGEIQDFLAKFGYKEIDKMGRDVIFGRAA